MTDDEPPRRRGSGRLTISERRIVTPPSDAVRVYETEREIPVHFKLELQIAAMPWLSGEQQSLLADQLSAALDRLILKAIYGGLACESSCSGSDS